MREKKASILTSHRNGTWQEYDRLTEAIGLNINEQSVISLVGGGGKTTTLCRLQKEYEEENIPSIVTTTTHMQKLEESWFLGEPSIDKLKVLLEKYGKAWCGELTKKGKLQSFPLPFLKEMTALGHTVIIEADGARRLPCKAPGPMEPVFVPETNIVLSLYGMDALGKKIADTCFRPELVAEILNKSEEDIIEAHDIAVLALSENGGRKSVTEKMRYQVILNKADGEAEKKAAREIAEELQKQGVERVHITNHLMDLREIRFGKLVLHG